MTTTQIPAIFRLPIFDSFLKTITGLSKPFKNKKQRQNFIALFASIVFNGDSLLSGVLHIIDSKSKQWVKALSHFLQSTAWPDDLLKKFIFLLLKNISVKCSILF